MREKNRKPIANNRKKLPQFTTMNVIDGQAGLIICSSLIFYSLTIDNILNIVVLLIFAGVTISMLTGENGIIKQAQNAKAQNRKGKIEEQVRLAAMAAKTKGKGEIDFDELNSELDKIGYEGEDIVTLPKDITIDGEKVTIKEDGSTVIPNEPKTLAESKTNESDVSKNTTFEDINGDKITIPAGFNVDKDSTIIVKEGIVIEDSEGNQYVWIPVFEKSEERDWGADYNEVVTAKTEENTKFTIEDYTAIQTALKAYTETYANSGYSDTWYGDSNSASGGYYKGEEFIYYTNGNMTQDNYNELYNNMLVSVYKNGGFYIGRYEMGTGVATSVETAQSLTRTNMTEYKVNRNTNVGNEEPSIQGMPTPVSKANAVGYTNITQSQAQMLAEKMGEEYGYGNTTSALMFGVQWDAVCVFLEKYGKLSDGTTAFDSSYLTSNNKSKLWGNVIGSTFTMDRGYYAKPYYSNPVTWKEKADNVSAENYWLCTTGASEQHRALNIYNFGGNLAEFTLEREDDDKLTQVVDRGGSIDMGFTAADRCSFWDHYYQYGAGTRDYINYITGRVALYI